MRTSRPKVTPTHLAAILLPCLLSCLSMADARREFRGPYVDTGDLLVVVIPRTPEQMAAFYEARGFPRTAIERLRQTCFVTVHIENRSRGIIWLDLDQWRFSRDGRPLHRLDREFWNTQWNDIDLRQASRSTFGWTQLPTLRDLQPDEPVGGNLVFPGDTDVLTIEASFPTGADREGTPVRIGFGAIRCRPETENP